MKEISDDYIDAEEASQRKPVELYHLWLDNGEEHWRYTSGDVPVTYSGIEYVPGSLSRTLVAYNTQLEVTTIDVITDNLESTVLNFISTNPIDIVWISIMKLHREQEPLEAGVVFIGQVKNVSFKGGNATVTCVGFEFFLKQTIPIWRYQLTCNHMLFNSKCTISEDDYKTTATVALNSTGTELTSTTFSSKVDGYFTGGKAVFDGKARTITNHESNVITLMYKFRELEDNDSIDAYPGCDGQAETCRDKYDNILNFLGFPFIPDENPAARVSW